MNNIKIYYTHDSSFQDSYKDPRLEDLGYRVYSSDDIDDTDESYMIDKYNLGIPDGHIDMIYEKSLVPEFHIDKLNGISFQKGCYSGQEVVARAKNVGEVRKMPCLLELSDSAVVSLRYENNEITQSGNKVGTLLSVYKNKAIGHIRTSDCDFISNVYACGQEFSLSKPKWLM